MDNNTNRWMATALLLAMFGIIAYAGTRSTARQTTQNVLVTNTTSQPIPMAARPTANGAYIVSVANTPGVKVANGADSTSADLYYGFGIPATKSQVYVYPALPNSTAVVIDSVSIYSAAANAGEHASQAWLNVFDNLGHQVGVAYFTLQGPSDNTTIGYYAGNYRVVVPKGGSTQLWTQRNGGTTSQTYDYFTFSYHTVPM